MIKIRRGIKKFISNFWGVIRLPEMSVLPGQLAFFFVLSVVPTVTIISYGAAFFDLSSDVIANFLTNTFSPVIADIVMPSREAFNMQIHLIIFILVSMFIASNGAASIITTSNAIYGVPNGNWFRRRLKAIVMTGFIVLLFIFILIVPLFGNTIVNLIQVLNLNEVVTRQIEDIFRILQGPISWFIMFLFIKIIYTMAPSRKTYSVYTNYGAIFTTVLWVIATAAYSFWISTFANHSLIHGGLANLVILMLWIYILAYVFVIGMAMNYREEELAKTANIKLE